MRTLERLLPFVLFSVVKSAPQLDPVELGGGGGGGEAEVQRPLTLGVLFGGQEAAEAALARAQELLSREWFEPWPQLQWLRDFFFRELASAAYKIPMTDSDPGGLLRSFLQLTEQVVLSLGAAFAKAHFAPHFESYIRDERELRAIFESCSEEKSTEAAKYFKYVKIKVGLNHEFLCQSCFWKLF